jgi:NAD(P)-dependent dehydrogenase (short-subunit alcohol dehydrogenase family)
VENVRPGPGTAVVTGGASGIGRRTVERLLAEGWRVWALDLNEKALAGFMEPATGDRYRYHRCDVRDVESLRVALAAVQRESVGIRALVCCAGVTIVSELSEMSIEQADLLFDVNVRGPWLTIREALPLLQREGSVADPSRVVVIGSIAGMRPKVGGGMYGATKAALHVIAGVYAVELAPTGVTVNALAPGTVDTPMSRKAASDALAGASPLYKTSGVSPLGRIAQPDDVADAVLFLLGGGAKYINGAVIPVDGGTRAAFLKE